MVWTTALMIFRPPGAPHARNGRSARSRRVGAPAQSTRLPGAIEFGRSGRGSNQYVPLVISIPVPRGMTADPKPPPSVAVSDTSIRSPSTAFTCVVFGRSAIVESRSPNAARVAPALRLHETLGRLESGRRPIGRATFAVVHALRLRILVQPRRERPEDERAVPIDEETLSGETDRRFEETSPGQLAEAAVSELVCRDSARHAHRQGALGIRVVFDRGPSVHAGSRIA